MESQIQFVIKIKNDASKKRIKALRTILSRTALGLQNFTDNDLRPYDDIIDTISLTKNGKELKWKI